jgi:hypothetical protein
LLLKLLLLQQLRGMQLPAGGFSKLRSYSGCWLGIGGETAVIAAVKRFSHFGTQINTYYKLMTDYRSIGASLEVMTFDIQQQDSSLIKIVNSTVACASANIRPMQTCPKGPAGEYTLGTKGTWQASNGRAAAGQLVHYELTRDIIGADCRCGRNSFGKMARPSGLNSMGSYP